MQASAGGAIGVPYHCPACAAGLVDADSTLRCRSCDRSHPFLGGGLPVLVQDPVGYLARNLATLRRIRAVATRGDEAAQADALIGLAKAHVAPLELARALGSREPAADTWSSSASLALARTYLKRDWSGSPEAEREVTTTVAAVREHLTAHCERRDAVLVVGSGLGRHAWELRDDFAEVHAVDHSYAMSGSLQLLRAGPLEVELVNEHVLLAEHERVAFRARLPEEAGDAGRFLPAIADLRALPFPAESFDCVVCVFPSLPTPDLAAHSVQMLKPGGVLVQFGPPLESVERAREVVIRAGFDVLGETFVETTLIASEASLHRSVWRSWSVAARKVSAAVVAMDARPAVADGVTFEVSATVSADSYVNQLAILRHPSLGSVPVREPLFSFLSRIDGERTVAAILDELAGHGLESDDAHELLRSAALTHLVATDIVRVQP